MCEKAGAGNIFRIVELALADFGVLLTREKVRVILRRQKRAEMMIEPPGNGRGRRILEIDDGILIAGKFRLVEQSAGTMHQTAKFILGVRRDALAMETREQRSGTGPIETFVVIKNTYLHL